MEILCGITPRKWHGGPSRRPGTTVWHQPAAVCCHCIWIPPWAVGSLCAGPEFFRLWPGTAADTPHHSSARLRVPPPWTVRRATATTRRMASHTLQLQLLPSRLSRNHLSGRTNVLCVRARSTGTNTSGGTYSHTRARSRGCASSSGAASASADVTSLFVMRASMTMAASDARADGNPPKRASARPPISHQPPCPTRARRQRRHHSSTLARLACQRPTLFVHRRIQRTERVSSAARARSPLATTHHADMRPGRRGSSRPTLRTSLDKRRRSL